MIDDIQAAIAAEVAVAPDQTKAQAGGERVIAAEGPTRLRFVSYVEVGQTEKTYKGTKKKIDQVFLTFELSGKNHPPFEIDGKSIPQRIVVKENKSLSERAGFFKLFRAMNYSQKHTHMAQALGESFLGDVSHYKFKGQDGNEVAIPQLRGENGYTIRQPRLLDPATEEWVVVPVQAAVAPLQVFFWNTPTKKQWDSLFVDGEYEERKDASGKVIAPAKSKNILQNRIKSALNFKGSAVETLLITNGVSLDIPDVDVDEDDGVEQEDTTTTTTTTKEILKGAAADDALAGIV